MHDVDTFEKVLDTNDHTTASSSTSVPQVPTGERIRTARIYAEKFDAAVEGFRNSAVYGHAVRLREKFGLHQSQTLEIMSDWNVTKCSPSLCDDELANIVKHAYKYAQKEAGSGYKPKEHSELPPPPVQTKQATSTEAPEEAESTTSPDATIKKERSPGPSSSPPPSSRSIANIANVNAEPVFSDFVPLGDNVIPEFPVDALPPGLSEYVISVSDSLAVPSDLPALLSLAAISIVCSGRYIVKPKPDWKEPTNLYVTVVMPPATRKSAVFSLMMSPIRDLEKELIKAQKGEVEQNKSDFTILETAKKDLEKKIANGKSCSLELLDITRQIAEFQHLNEPTLVVSDATVEAVGKLLAMNGGRLGIISAEGGLFSEFAGRYSNKPVNDIFLSGHIGDSLKIIRVGRDSDYIERPALAMGLCVQPTIFEHLEHKRLLEDSGMLGRFIYAYPETAGRKSCFGTPEVPCELKEIYEVMLRKIFKAAYPLEKPLPIMMSPEAVRAFRDYYDNFENRISEDGDLNSILSWAGKLRGHILRIAACLELAAWGMTEQVAAPVISKGSLLNAIEIGEYAITHAQRVFGLLGMDKDTQLAVKIEAWIRNTQKEEFTRRKVFERFKGSSNVSRVQDLDAAILHLIGHGYIGRKKAESKPGRPSVIYSVNPEIHSQY